MKEFESTKYLIAIFVLLAALLSSCNNTENKTQVKAAPITKTADAITEQKDYEIIVGSFLGDDKRCYYGENPPSSLNLIWKCWLGGAPSQMPKNSTGSNVRYGAGWTGQPLLFKEKDVLYLIQGSYDYNLRKINASNGEVVWKYKFDDAIKGTGTLYYNQNSKSEESRFVVLQGSRQSAASIYNFRCISLLNGGELFRMKIERTRSSSRDIDGSTLIIGDSAYIGLENGIFKVFDPNSDNAVSSGKFYEPEVFNELNLFSSKDIARVGGNIITESSPAYLNGKIYITAGSGNVYGYDIAKGEIDWEYFIGSDLDGSPVITEDSCLLVPVEKQFIAGNGGLLKLDPRKSPENALVWYFPVGNFHMLSWDGGVIGSASINDKYKSPNSKSLAAFSGIDGYLYVVDYKSSDGTANSFDGKTTVDKPELIFKYKTGSSISSPIIFKDKLISCGYGGIYLFKFDENYNFTLIEKKNYYFEATPVVYDGKVFVASKDGWLYCFGDEK
ncbi:MAG: PQQ-binding-like beta-propeller repeat protein [Bacteroidetes bacterium]|nr:PQQ-binding-like beta-propeller repeat protein [Bacteroidota bacterium]